MIDWNPYWFAGIPILQFYPPGFILFGIGCYYLTLGIIPLGLLYNLLLLFTLIFPAITGYLLLRKLAFQAVPSFFSALFLLVLIYIGAASGVYYGLIIGLINSRIALGLAPVVFYFGFRRLTQQTDWISFFGLTVTLALIILFHPDYILYPLVGLIIQAILFNRAGVVSVKKLSTFLILPVLLALGITAFWWFPFIMHHNQVASAQIWSGKIKMSADWQGLVAFLIALPQKSANKFLLLLYLAAIPKVFRKSENKIDKLYLIGLMLTPIILLVFIGCIQLILIGILHIYLIDPARLRDGVMFAVILVAGIGLYQILEITYQNLIIWKQAWKRKIICIVAMICLFLALYYTGRRLYIYNDYSIMFSRYALLNYMIRSQQLDELWSYLKTSDTGTGRILFSSIGVPINELPSNFRAEILCLTPLYTGRQIVGGVNAPAMAVGTYFFSGEKLPAILRDEIDKYDNVSLFGIPWEKMDETRLYEFCTKLNITTVVVHLREDKVISFLAQSSRIKFNRQLGDFLVFSVSGYHYNWLDYDSSKVAATLESFGEDNLRIKVISAKPNSILTIKTAYFPCWQATGLGNKIPINSNELGLIQLRLPEGNNYLVTLTYQSTGVEKTGWTITFLSILAFIVYCFIPRRKKNSLS